MIPYWMLFTIPALIALSRPPVRSLRQDGTRYARLGGDWVLVLSALTVMIGLRYRVGGDWGAYFLYLEQARIMSLAETLARDDPGYRLLNVLGLVTGGDIVFVNFVSALVFSIGLVAFCRSTPRPWLALTVAIPYLVVVVSMGYTRQSVAIGLVMLGLVAAGRKKPLLFVFWILMAGLFHKSAIVMLPLIALTATRNRWLIVLIVAVTGAVAYTVLLQDHADNLIRNYIEAQYASAGALIRLAMNAVPAALFLIYRKRIIITPSEYAIWRLFSVISLLLFLAYFTTGASTALDRLALYMIPLQLFVFSHLPDLLGRYNRMWLGNP
jgi:hypothetical protein